MLTPGSLLLDGPPCIFHGSEGRLPPHPAPSLSPGAASSERFVLRPEIPWTPASGSTSDPVWSSPLRPSQAPLAKAVMGKAEMGPALWLPAHSQALEGREEEPWTGHEPHQALLGLREEGPSGRAPTGRAGVVFSEGPHPPLLSQWQSGQRWPWLSLRLRVPDLETTLPVSLRPTLHTHQVDLRVPDVFSLLFSEQAPLVWNTRQIPRLLGVARARCPTAGALSAGSSWAWGETR